MTRTELHGQLNGYLGLVQHWLKTNMSIPVPQLARMLLKWAET
jgi:hypothetical protein